MDDVDFMRMIRMIMSLCANNLALYIFYFRKLVEYKLGKWD